MSQPTPAVQRVRRELEARFPGLRFEFNNCRHIGRNPLKPWSQHAGSEPKRGWYGNAGDVFDPENPYGSPLLDRVAAWLKANEERLGIRVILWRVKNHFDHIHFDTWPMMFDKWWYTPPCKGGALRTVLKDGTKSDTFALDDTEDEMEYVQIGDTGLTVKKIQKAINGYRKQFQPTLPLLEVDGDFGPLTREAVDLYQQGAEIPRYDAGIVGQVTMSLLMEYVVDWADPPPTPPSPGGITSGSSVVLDGDGFNLDGTITEKE